MKNYHNKYAFLWIIGMVLSSGCGPIVVTEEFQRFNTIYVGWVDLAENNYSKYGYGTKKEWLDEIKTQNIDSFQSYTKGYMRGWNVIGANSKSSAIPWGDPKTLVILFSNVVFNPGMNQLECEMGFYHGGNKKLLKRIHEQPSLTSYSPTGGYYNISFGGRLSNAMYLMAYDIKYYLTTKGK